MCRLRGRTRHGWLGVCPLKLTVHVALPRRQRRRRVELVSRARRRLNSGHPGSGKVHAMHETTGSSIGARACVMYARMRSIEGVRAPR